MSTSSAWSGATESPVPHSAGGSGPSQCTRRARPAISRSDWGAGVGVVGAGVAGDEDDRAGPGASA